MAYKRKLKQGDLILSIKDFEAWTSNPRNYVFWHSKGLHPYWMRSMQFNLISRLIENGELFKAERITDSV